MGQRPRQRVGHDGEEHEADPRDADGRAEGTDHLGVEQALVADRQVQERLERLALLLAGERVGGEDARHHERDDEEQRRDEVPIDEHYELLAFGQPRDR